MADIKYVGKSVNNAVSELTSVGNRFQPVSSQTQTKTGVMLGCKGFDKVAQVPSNYFSGKIDENEQKLSQLVGQIRVKQTKILEFSDTPQDDIDDFIEHSEVHFGKFWDAEKRRNKIEKIYKITNKIVLIQFLISVVLFLILE
jgi:hypothetical protein